MTLTQSCPRFGCLFRKSSCARENLSIRTITKVWRLEGLIDVEEFVALRALESRRQRASDLLIHFDNFSEVN
jgi:hypothetical protein